MASRSLGALTLDLIMKIGGFTQGATQAERQMDRTNRKLAAEQKKLRADMEKAWTNIGNAIGIGLGGAVTAAGALTARVIGAGSEIAKLSQISNASVAEFQAMAAGANTVGISQEKLADQFKDFNEKVGEFQQTGGGGMKDFFEQIAPKVGITADAFKKLSGPQALQLYYDSLQKAGLGQKEMSFYLESMASDTTALIPLLRDGGAGFKEMGDRARAMGSIMSDETIAASKQLSDDLKSLDKTVVGLSAQVAGPGVSALAELTRYLLKVSETEGIARASLITFGRIVAGITGHDEFGKLNANAEAAQAKLKRLTDQAERYQEAIDRGSNVEGNTRNLERTRASIEATSKEAASLSQALKDLANGSDAAKPSLPGVDTKSAPGKPPAKASGDGPTKALLTNQLKDFDRLVQEQAGLMADRNRMLDLYNGQGLVSIRDYYDAQRAILDEATADQVKAYDAQIAALEKYRASATKKTDRADADGKIAELEAKRAKVQQETGLAKIELDVKQKESTKQLADSVQDLTTKMMELRGQSVEAAKVNFDKANEGLRKMLEANGDQAGLANLNALRDAAVAQATLNDVTAKFALIQSDLGDAEQRIQFDREAGIVTELEGLARTGDARRERLQLMQAEIDRILALKAVMTLTPEQEDALRKLTGQVEKIKRSTDPIGDSIKTSLEGFSTTLFNDIITGSKSAKNALNDFSKSVLNEFNSLISKKLGQELMKSLFGGKTTDASGGSSSGFFGSALSSVVKWLGTSWGFADGGYTGPGGKYQPAGIVHKGEGVLNQGDMARIGGPAGFAQLVSTIRSARGYASGGVGGSSSMPFAPAASAGFGNVNIYNQAGAAVTAEKRPNAAGGMDLILMIKKDIKNEIGGELATDSGVMGQAMRARRARGL